MILITGGDSPERATNILKWVFRVLRYLSKDTLEGKANDNRMARNLPEGMISLRISARGPTLRSRVCEWEKVMASQSSPSETREGEHWLSSSLQNR